METISDSSGIRGSVESFIGGRKENQDSYGMSETRLGMLVVVCDGMGGGPAGKTASHLATQAIIDYISGATPDQNPVDVMKDAVVSANEALLAAVAQNPSLQGMGTTCVGVLIAKNNTAYIVHVGDSRCYQLRGDRAVFRTSDHSYVAEMVKKGQLTEEEARNSSYSNVITRAIGAAQQVVPEVDTVTYKSHDRFALMSDGIWGTMPEPQLVRMLGARQDPATLVPQIAAHVDALGVNSGGQHDNLTLALVDIPALKHATVNSDTREQTRSIAPAPAQRLAAQPMAQPKAQPLHNKSERGRIEVAPRRSNAKNPIILGLCGVVVVCIAIIAILVIKPSGNGKVEEEDQIVLATPNQTNEPSLYEELNNTPEEDKAPSDKTAPEQTTPQSKEESTQTQTQEMVREIMDLQKKEETPTPQSQTTNNTIKSREKVQQAIDKLKSLKTYKSTKESVPQAREEREKICRTVISLVTSASATEDNAAVKQKLMQIATDMGKQESLKKMRDVDFKRESTGEANKEIDKYVSQLSNL